MKKTIILTFCLIGFSALADSQGILKERIAITRFEILSDKETTESYQWMSLGFAESLSDAFSRINRFSVIERARLEQVLSEQKLQRSSGLDSTSVVKAGKLLGVQKIILGSCQIVTGHLMVNMRIVNVESGEISPVIGLPIIRPLDSILYVQKRICVKILEQFDVFITAEEEQNINVTTAKSTKNLKAYEFLTKGIALYDNGYYGEALAMFNTAIDYDKKYRKAFYRRGATRFVLSDYVSAASDFGKAEIYLPKDSVYYLIGNSYLKQGDRKKARKYLEKALNLNPDNLSFLQALSQVRRNSDTVAIVTYTTISDVYVPLETYPTEITDSIDNEPPGKIETTYEYFAGIAKVRSKRKYGFIDTLGQLVVPFIYDDVRSFKWSFAAYRKGNLWGFLGHSGTPVIEARFLAVEDFDGLGVAAVKQESGWGVINVSGDIIIPAEFSSIDPFHFDSLLFVRKIVNNRFLWGIYTIQGRLVSPPIYTDFNNFWFDNPTYKYIHLSLNGKWGVVDRENKTIIPFNYYGNNSIRFFKNGFAPVKVNERWGFVDLNGEEVVKPVFDNVKNFENGFFEVKQKGMWGIIDLRGDTIIPFIYDELKHLKFNFWAVRKNQKWAFTDIKENKTTQFLFDEVFNEIVSSITQKDLKIEPIKSSKIIVRVKNNGRQFYANEKGSCVLNCRE